jgi:hypothetical protein
MLLRQVSKQFASAGKRPELRGVPQVRLGVLVLDTRDILGRQGAPGFPRKSTDKQPAAHADPAMNAPNGQRHASDLRSIAPRENMLVHDVNNRAIEIE